MACIKMRCVHTLLSARLLNLGCLAVSHQSVVWLELLHRLGRVVHECETCALATTVLCLEAEDGDLVLGRLVKFGELAAELILGDVGAVWVKDIAVERSSLAWRWHPGYSSAGGLTRPSACGRGEGCG